MVTEERQSPSTAGSSAMLLLDRAGIEGMLIRGGLRVQEAEVPGAPTHQAGSGEAKVLNWFPVRFRIDSKVLLLVYKSQQGFGPKTH